MFCLADKSCCYVERPSDDIACIATFPPQQLSMEHPQSIEHPTSKCSLCHIYAFYENVNSMDSRKVAYKEWPISITGEDCDEKTNGLEVMDVN